MKRYILTGTPGSGKTSLLRGLEGEGYCVVEEAATDVIAREQSQGNSEPWKQRDFIDKIVRLQRQRQVQTSGLRCDVQLYDRSPICTVALSRYLQYPPSKLLLEEIERIEREQIYARQAFFIESLGFCEPTKARTISVEEAAVFEKIHWEAYQSFGYECLRIPRGPLDERLKTMRERLAEWRPASAE
jgi:predicted ATPase